MSTAVLRECAAVYIFWLCSANLPRSLHSRPLTQLQHLFFFPPSHSLVPHHDRAPCPPPPPIPATPLPPLPLLLQRRHATTGALNAVHSAPSPIAFAATPSATKRSIAMARFVVPTTTRPIRSSALIGVRSVTRGSRGMTKLLELGTVWVILRWRIERV